VFLLPFLRFCIMVSAGLITKHSEMRACQPRRPVGILRAMSGKLMIERTAGLRADTPRPAGIDKPLRANLAQADRDRQWRLALYAERAAKGLPLFSPPSVGYF